MNTDRILEQDSPVLRPQAIICHNNARFPEPAVKKGDVCKGDYCSFLLLFVEGICKADILSKTLFYLKNNTDATTNLLHTGPQYYWTLQKYYPSVNH